MLRHLLAKPSSRIALQTRAFHSPFAVLSPKTSSSSSASAAAPGTSACQGLSAAAQAQAAAYEKQVDARPDPVGLAGARTYVVSGPDPAGAAYAVPFGAYPVAAPYDQH